MKNLQIDVLVNNAGVTDDSLFLRMDLKKWNKVINTNLNSNFMISNFFSKQMIKKKWGRIINIASIWGVNPCKKRSFYSITKSSLISFSKSTCLTLQKSFNMSKSEKMRIFLSLNLRTKKTPFVLVV